MGEGGEEALEAGGDRVGGAIFGHLDMDEAGGPVDGDEDVALARGQGRQMLQVDMDEADAGLLEDAGLRRHRLRPAIEPVAHEAAMDAAARERSPDAAAERKSVVEGKS